MSQLLKFTDPTDPSGDTPVYFDAENDMVITVQPTGTRNLTKITDFGSGTSFLVADPIDQVCSLLEGTQRAK